MKKVCSLILACVLCLGVFGLSAWAEEAGAASAFVYVTVIDGEGKPALALEPVTVTDTDSDGALTVNDALYAAHEAHYDGGAAAGYAFSMGAYGLQLDKLWGTANGGAYGYYVNHESALSLGDVIGDGDVIAAYVYTDLEAWSDAYCYFDMDTVELTQGDEVTLTLMAWGFDENWMPVSAPVAGAVITVDGEATSYVTDEAGKVTVTVDQAGEVLIGAISDTRVLVSPVCLATVAQADTQTTAPTPSETAGGEVGTTDGWEPSEEFRMPWEFVVSTAVTVLALLAIAVFLILKLKKR